MTKECKNCRSILTGRIDRKTFCSLKCSGKWLANNNPLSIKAIRETFDKYRPKKHSKRPEITGVNHPNYKGKLYYSNRYKENHTPEYQEWRRKVLQRDENCCQHCGSTEHLQVHHKMNYTRYPQFRHEVKNGETLCKSCHLRYHSLYGKGFSVIDFSLLSLVA